MLTCTICSSSNTFNRFISSSNCTHFLVSFWVIRCAMAGPGFFCNNTNNAAEPVSGGGGGGSGISLFPDKGRFCDIPLVDRPAGVNPVTPFTAATPTTIPNPNPPPLPLLLDCLVVCLADNGRWGNWSLPSSKWPATERMRVLAPLLTWWWW